MTLEILQKEMIAAMKNHDKLRKETISSIIGAVKKMAIDEKCKENIAEELVNRVLMKEKKTMQEMIDTCPVDRVEILKEYKERMKIIDEFVPKMMSEDEVRESVLHIVNDENVEMSKGVVMKAVMPRLKGKADGKLINKVVGEIVRK